MLVFYSVWFALIIIGETDIRSEAFITLHNQIIWETSGRGEKKLLEVCEMYLLANT